MASNPAHPTHDLQGTYKNGIATTQAAIASKDVTLFRRCITRFADIKAPMETILEALKDCPMTLLRESGYKIHIFSHLLERDIVIGDDNSLSWPEFLLIAQHGIKGDHLRAVMEARAVFNDDGAFIEMIETL